MRLSYQPGTNVPTAQAAIYSNPDDLCLRFLLGMLERI